MITGTGQWLVFLLSFLSQADLKNRLDNYGEEED
jgi:hypothetical protein